MLMSQNEWVPISMGNSSCNYWRAIHALPAEYKCLINKTEQSIYRYLLGFYLTTFSAPPQILAASTVTSFNSRNENDG